MVQFQVSDRSSSLDFLGFLQKNPLFCKLSINLIKLVARLTSKFEGLQAVQTHPSIQ